MSFSKEPVLIPENSENWEVTTIYEVERRVTFSWQIVNYSRIQGREKIRSPSFSSSFTKWAIDLYPNGINAEYAGKISIFLVKILPLSEISAEVRICLKDKNVDRYSKKLRRDFCNNENSCGLLSFIDRDTLMREKKTELLPGDVLTLYCEVTFKEDVIHEAHRVPQQGPCKDSNAATLVYPRAIETLLKDFEALLREPKISDMTLEVGSEKFPVHKALLSARSSVFAAMFDHDMKENRSSIVAITDMEPAVMGDLLQYIYTGSVGDMSVEKAVGLYPAADKYALLELKAHCGDVMQKNLTVENVVDVAFLADAHNDGMIIDSIKMFVLKNTNILSTEKWKRLAEQNPRLAYEIALAFTLLSQSKS